MYVAVSHTFEFYEGRSKVRRMIFKDTVNFIDTVSVSLVSTICHYNIAQLIIGLQLFVILHCTFQLHVKQMTQVEKHKVRTVIKYLYSKETTTRDFL